MTFWSLDPPNHHGTRQKRHCFLGVERFLLSSSGTCLTIGNMFVGGDQLQIVNVQFSSAGPAQLVVLFLLQDQGVTVFLAHGHHDDDGTALWRPRDWTVRIQPFEFCGTAPFRAAQHLASDTCLLHRHATSRFICSTAGYSTRATIISPMLGLLT